MKNGVTFNDKHSITDWGFVTTKIEIGEPEPKTHYIDIPGMNGSLDLTEAIGEVVYNNRIINIEFVKEESDTLEHSIGYLTEQRIRSYLHGQEMDIYFDSDKTFYWHGRVSVKSVDMTQKGIIVITVEANVEPYKYDTTFNDNDWLWDPFDFNSGIINFSRFTINGTYTYSFVNRSMRVSPTITASADMVVKFKNKNINIIKGTHKIYDIRFDEGENELTFIGNGTVEVTYKVGVL